MEVLTGDKKLFRPASNIDTKLIKERGSKQKERRGGDIGKIPLTKTFKVITFKSIITMGQIAEKTNIV